MTNKLEKFIENLISKIGIPKKPSKKEVNAMVKRLEKLSYLEMMVLIQAIQIVGKRAERIVR